MNRDRLFLKDVLERCERVNRYVSHGREQFDTDEMLQDAIVRNLEVIGEAINQVSDDARDLDKTVPWRQIVGMRNKLIHHYFGVNLDLVWETALVMVPDLEDKVREVLVELDRQGL